MKPQWRAEPHSHAAVLHIYKQSQIRDSLAASLLPFPPGFTDDDSQSK